MRKAIVLISFGTTYKEKRIAVIDKIKEKFGNEFENYEIFSSYSSKFIVDLLRKKESEEVKSTDEIFSYLSENKYREIIVQPLFIVNGFEYEKLKDKIDLYNFKKVSLMNSLLHKDCDYEKIASSLAKENIENNEAIIYMAHGSFHKEDENYKIMEKYLQNINKNIYIATIESEMCIFNLKEKLKINNTRKVYLKPFMLISGKHIIKDMISDDKTSWKSIFEEDGFLVQTSTYSLGENEVIQELYLESAVKNLKEKINENNCRD